MANVAADAVKECAKTVILDALKEWYSYITNFHDNIQVVRTKYHDLNSLKDRVESQIKSETDNLRKITKPADDWLVKVQKLKTNDELKQLLDEEKIKGMDQCCFGRMQCNLKQRYKMSKAADKITKEIDRLISGEPEPSKITESLTVSELKSAPGEFLATLQSRVDLMEKVLKKLQDDDVDVVGIFGMGAIGKTTLVKEISKRAKTKFGNPVMVEISEAPNMERIQYQIADQLGIQNLSDSQSIEYKANLLLTGLTRKGSRTLVILDNIWEKLDLAKVGIPQQSDKSSEFCCKLMVTSRKKDVCKVMGVQDTENIFEVSPLNETEAKLLFRKRVGKKDDEMNEHDEEAEKKILKKCGGLPLSIVAIADVLKDQDLSTWEHYASELEKSFSMHGSIKDANRRINSIIGTSYRLIESEEKKKFFLLACLFPFGSSIRVEDMMRYGIGKGLFQDVNNLNEAMDQANTWADELVSSSLLSLPDNSYTGSRVKIQDVVRASTIALAKQDGEVFMVEAFPRWRELETCKKYTAISLMSGTDHSRLGGLMSDNNLEMLFLDDTKPPEFDDTFFEHLNNLKVLVLSGWNWKKCDGFLRTPTNSFQRWKSSLRTLHLECCDLGDIAGIGGLINLVVLNLRDSRLKELPGEAIMGNLVKLRLLDLSCCQIFSKGIPAKVLARLTQLEGLYLSSSNIKKWGHNNSVQATGGTEGASTSSTQHAADEGSNFIDDDKYASIDELNRLSYLNVLEMEVRLEDLPAQGDQFVKNLERFNVKIDNDISIGRWENPLSRSLILYYLDLRKMRIIKCVKALLLKTEQLSLYAVVGFEERYLHDEKEFIVRWGNLKYLTIEKCNKELLEIIKWSAFPNLETLKLGFMDNSRIMGHSSLSAGDEAQVGGRAATLSATGKNTCKVFSNLQRLTLWSLKNLEPYVMPIHVLPLNHLTFISVDSCRKLRYIFGEAEKETDQKNKDPHPHLKLPHLKNLKLGGLNELESMVEVPNSSEDEDPPPLFTKKLIFAALEQVYLTRLNSIERLWDVAYWKGKDNADYRSSFLNLNTLKIRQCGKMKTLCPVSVAAALVHLKTLRIWNCGEMREAVVKDDDDKESDCDGRDHGVPFPSLEDLKLVNCPKMAHFITAKQSYVFTSLQLLKINRCHEMQSLSVGSETFRAPNLTYFKYDKDRQSIPEGGEINEFLKARYQQRIRSQSGRASGADIGQQS